MLCDYTVLTLIGFLNLILGYEVMTSNTNHVCLRFAIYLLGFVKSFNDFILILLRKQKYNLIMIVAGSKSD